MLIVRILGLAAGAALFALVATAPAHAQFFSNYPVIVVPPPPAQNYVLPKPKPQAPKPAQAQPPDASPPQIQCQFHGQTRVCE